jgi:hypothetical protein
MITGISWVTFGHLLDMRFAVKCRMSRMVWCRVSKINEGLEEVA